MTKRILILSAAYGEGHQQAAKAINDHLGRLDPTIEVQVVDYMELVNPRLHAVAKYSYLQSIKLAPRLYGEFYRRTMKITPQSPVQHQLNRIGNAKFLSYLRQYRPDFVICTFTIPAGVMSLLRRQGKTQIPFATVITDYTVHNQWIHPMTEMYFVGSELVRQGIIRRGISPAAIHATGIPIRRIFNQPVDVEALRAKYGLRSGMLTILLMGGAFGVLSRMRRISQTLLDLQTPVQLLVICGRNRRVRKQIEEETSEWGPDRIRIFGYVEEMNEMMAISDLIVTKAGGLTTTEALAMGTPMLIYKPIPGQEEQNAKYLVRSDVAVVARNRQRLQEQLRTLVVHPERLKRMSANTALISKPAGAAAISQLVVDFLKPTSGN